MKKHIVLITIASILTLAIATCLIILHSKINVLLNI